ncbi:MAG TPA: sigma 54-interacting transcriptional regulator [Polyangiaceae bacterium]
MVSEARAPDDEQSTTTSAGSDVHGVPLVSAAVSGLVVAWYREDTSRIGELAIVPDDGSMVILGRGALDTEPRMRFFRPRPGRLEPTEPLASRGLSRRQLELVSDGDGLRVRRVGRCPMRINGVECDEGVLSPGDTLAFRQELVMLFVRRPACPPALTHHRPASSEPFGGADSLGILGESPAAWRLRDELAFAALSGRHVLLVGDSGTGKELAAHAIQRLSSRADRPFVARNAATLPPSLIDAEMFGNLKNYPNPGTPERSGLVGQANGGFLFLDEIGELPLELQSHLLRVLDSGGEYQRLGESASRRSDFRLLAATNRDPAELRHDLLARLTVKVELPPLSERREDIPLLVRHLVTKAAEGDSEFVRRFTERVPGGLTSAKVDAKLIDALLRWDYIGNVRELEALLWKAIGASTGEFIALPDGLTNKPVVRNATVAAGESLQRTRNREPGEEEIREALRLTGGSVAKAATLLGLSSRYALYRMLVKLRIEPDEGA